VCCKSKQKYHTTCTSTQLNNSDQKDRKQKSKKKKISYVQIDVSNEVFGLESTWRMFTCYFPIKKSRRERKNKRNKNCIRETEILMRVKTSSIKKIDFFKLDLHRTLKNWLKNKLTREEKFQLENKIWSKNVYEIQYPSLNKSSQPNEWQRDVQFHRFSIIQSRSRVTTSVTHPSIY
jgi:hypothetical protein